MKENKCEEYSPVCESTPDTPILCPDNTCKKSIAECGTTADKCKDGEIPCKNGGCSKNGKCLNSINCEEEKSFRCANSQCVSDPSECPVTLMCDADKVKIINNKN
ncbi:MAG: hypothetical protein MJ252_24940 [archaeon]|nr:hypothetical protein [archaeon]